MTPNNFDSEKKLNLYLQEINKARILHGDFDQSLFTHEFRKLERQIERFKLMDKIALTNRFC